MLEDSMKSTECPAHFDLTHAPEIFSPEQQTCNTIIDLELRCPVFLYMLQIEMCLDDRQEMTMQADCTSKAGRNLLTHLFAPAGWHFSDRC